MSGLQKLLIFYYSRTGNTEKMARAVEAGARTVQGIEVRLEYLISAEELANFDAMAI